jgi:hypothetical protein
VSTDDAGERWEGYWGHVGWIVDAWNELEMRIDLAIGLYFQVTVHADEFDVWVLRSVSARQKIKIIGQISATLPFAQRRKYLQDQLGKVLDERNALAHQKLMVNGDDDELSWVVLEPRKGDAPARTILTLPDLVSRVEHVQVREAWCRRLISDVGSLSMRVHDEPMITRGWTDEPLPPPEF